MKRFRVLSVVLVAALAFGAIAVGEAAAKKNKKKFVDTQVTATFVPGTNGSPPPPYGQGTPGSNPYFFGKVNSNTKCKGERTVIVARSDGTSFIGSDTSASSGDWLVISPVPVPAGNYTVFVEKKKIVKVRPNGTKKKIFCNETSTNVTVP